MRHMHSTGREDTIEAKIMKYHALSKKLAKFGGRVCYLQDQTDLLDGHSLTNATENSSESQFIVFINLHFVI